MTALTDAPVPTADTPTVTKDNSGVKFVVAALVASVAVLGVTALLSDGRVGDGRTNSLSTYVTGQTANVGPSTSNYSTGEGNYPANVTDDAEQHRTQLGR